MNLLNFITKWNAEILAVANFFIATGTIILAFGIPWSILYSVREKRDAFYATLDRTYFEIQKTIIEHPHLSRPGAEGKTPDQIAQYDAFAFMVWNFIESIFDYAEGDKVLRETWDCILRHEARLHRAWFNERRNRAKFKERFVKFIERENCAPDEQALSMNEGI